MGSDKQVIEKFEGEDLLTSIDHIRINGGIKELIEYSRTQYVIVQRKKTEDKGPIDSEKQEEVEVEEKIDKVEIPPKTKIPNTIKFALMRNIDKVDKVEKVRKKIVEEIKDEFDSSNRFDKDKAKEDKDYEKNREKEFESFVLEHELYKEFVDSTKYDINYYKLNFVEEKTNKKGDICLKDIDPNDEFDITLIPEVLINRIFSFEA